MSHCLLQQPLWLPQLVEKCPVLAIAPKNQVSRYSSWGTGDETVERDFWVCQKTPSTAASRAEGWCQQQAEEAAAASGSQSSPLLRGSLESPPSVGLAAVNTWGNNSRNTQGKGKTKKQTGLAMHRKYSHPQGLLCSWGRGDKSSLRRHCSQRVFPTQPFGGPKPDIPLLWDTAKKKGAFPLSPWEADKDEILWLLSAVCWLCFAWMFFLLGLACPYPPVILKFLMNGHQMSGHSVPKPSVPGWFSC